MLFSIRLLSVCALVAVGFSACKAPDNQLTTVPAVPSQYRLKSVQSTMPGSATQSAGASTFNGNTYTYSYDNKNRLTQIDRVTSGETGQSLLVYGDPDRTYSDGDNSHTFYVDLPSQVRGLVWSITRYPLSINGTDFTAGKYGMYSNKKINTQYNIINYQYTFDASKHIKSFETSGGQNSGTSDYNRYSYTYTADNITAEQFATAAGHGLRGTVTYTYDDKTNPFYTLLDPAVDVFQRFSRNNVKSLTFSTTGSSTTYPTTYAYEYNAQGLPTKRTATYKELVVEVLTYTYENY